MRYQISLRKLKKKLGLAGVFIIFAIFLAYSVNIINDITPKDDNTICYDNHCFSVKLAITDEEKREGLMGVEDMEDDEGMLFLYDESDIHTFWMKDTLIPLDIIWIDDEDTIVHIQENAQPCIPGEECTIIDPKVRSDKVLEINGGLSKELGLEVGDRLEIHTNEG